MENFPKGSKNDPLWWVITIGLFCTGSLWFVALALLILNVNGKLPPVPALIAWLKAQQGKNRLDAPGAQQSSEQKPYDAPRAGQQVSEIVQKPRRPVGNGVLRTVFGAILTALGSACLLTTGILPFVVTFPRGLLISVAVLLAVGSPMLLTGVGLLFSASRTRKKKRRFAALQRMLGAGAAVPIDTIADMAGQSYAATLRDLEEMIDRGYFPVGAWIDRAAKKLMLTPFVPQEEPPEQPEQTITEAERVLRQIRADNDLIDDVEISRKIDRIEELTRKIFAFQAQNPERSGELRSFMNYYLPQTLKLLETYARLEAQGVEGENIAETKQKIGTMLDKLADGYERQLDKLFTTEAIDITADIHVMEQMLAKDGLTENEFEIR